MLVDDGVEAEQVPQPARQIDVAETACIAPTDIAHSDAHAVGVVRQRHRVIIGKQPQLLGLALAVVKDHGALPAAFLIRVEFAEMRDDLLPRPGVRAHAFDEREVGVLLAGFGANVAAEEHLHLRKPNSGDPESLPGRFPLHCLGPTNHKKPRSYCPKIFKKWQL